MKINKTALTVLSLIVTNAALAAEVFSDGTTTLDIHGRLQGMYYFADDKDVDGDNSYVRIGLNGESKVNDEIYVFGLYELEFKSNRRDLDGIEDDEFDIRRGYVGVATEYTTFSYGRQYGAVTLVSDYTDIFPEFGNEAAGVNADVFGTGRSDAVFKGTVDIVGLNVHASYQAENDEVSTDSSSYGIAADYRLPLGFKFALGYNEGETLKGGNDAELFTSAISYKYDEFYVAVLHSEGKNWAKDGSDINVDYTGVEAVATYKMTDGLLALVGYNKLKRNDVSTVNYVSVGAEINLAENFKALTEYRINNVENEEDIFAIAARYSF